MSSCNRHHAVDDSRWGVFPEATRGPHVVACLPTAALSLGRARPDAVAAGIQADVTGECALEAIDRAMHGAGSARLSDVEPDIVTVAVAAFQPPQIGSDLEARKRAIEVRPCPLCKMFACVLAERRRTRYCHGGRCCSPAATDRLRPEARKRAIEVRPCPLCKMFACVLAKHTGPMHRLSAWLASKAAASASTAWANNARAPLRSTAVSGSVKVPGWESWKTLVSVTPMMRACARTGRETPRTGFTPAPPFSPK